MNFLNKKLTLKRKKSIIGFLFISPFLIGFLFFFIVPFFQSFVFSLNELSVTRTGYQLNFVSTENYSFALLVHTEFIRVFTETVQIMLTDLPLIIFFSFFAALLLNQKFRGRLAARTIFFLPVILSSGIIITMGGARYASELLEQTSESVFLSGEFIETFLLELQIPENFIDYIITGVQRLPEVIRASGIQILIFLAGLQSISPSYYEASSVEGATSWENFWLITFPLMSPVILINVIYTIIDSFLSRENQLVNLIQEEAFTGAGYGVSTAMGVMYFLAIIILLLITGGLISRRVFYQE